MQQQNAEVSRADKEVQDEDDHRVILEKDEEVPDNPDEQWSVASTIAACLTASFQVNLG